MKKLVAHLGAFAALVVLFAANGCGEGYPSYCDNKMKCEGGNDNDKSACVDQLEGNEETAEDYNCGDQYDALFTCQSDGASCVQGRYGTQANCSTQENALQTCEQTNSARK